MFRKRILTIFCSLLVLAIASPRVDAESEPIQKTSFDEVTKKLDPGGVMYLYLSSDQWLKSFEENAVKFRNTLSVMAQKSDQREVLVKGADLFINTIKKSGFGSINGIGMSSIELKEKLYHNKIVLNHNPKEDQGLLWSLFGKRSGSLSFIKLLPSNTAFANYNKMDIPLFWSWIKTQIQNSDLPNLQKSFSEMEEKWAKNGVDDKFFNSLGKQIGILMTLDEKKPLALPFPGFNEVPSPALAIVISTKNDIMFQLLKKQFESSGMQIEYTENGALKKLAFPPIPLPFPIEFKPVLVQHGTSLILASNDSIVKAMSSSKKNNDGLISTDEFKSLSENIPIKGNFFKYVSPKLGALITKIQDVQMTMIMKKANPNAEPPPKTKSNDFKMFMVGANGPDGYTIRMNSNFHLGQVIMAQSVAIPAVLAGMLLPALNSAREKARRISCASNLKQIGLSLLQYCMDHNDAFPKEDGAAGLQVLRKGDYLSNSKLYICPSTTVTMAPEGSPITDKTCSYIYFGGFNYNDDKNIPIAMDKLGDHKSFFNVLFLDGHVTGYAIRCNSYVEVINYLNKRTPFPKATFDKLIEKARIFDQKMK